MTSILQPAVRTFLDSYGIAGDELACDQHLADTTAFCEHYHVAPDEACNAIIVAIKTNPKQFAACLVRADTKLDVNHKVAGLLGTRRLSFAPAEETLAVTGQQIGGVTVFGLPVGIPLLVDSRVMEREQIVVGGGNRTSKLRLHPSELLKIPGVQLADIANPRA